MKQLLICIAHHHSTERLTYLRRVLKAFEDEYEVTHDIIVDANVADLDVRGENLTVVSHVSLDHPFWLTWQHRRHIKDRIDDYEWFAYLEDDIYLPFENFQNYQSNFADLWPHFIPSFIRVEEYAGEEWVLDVTKRQPLVEILPGYCALRESYHGFWIMPQKALKETLRSDFVRLDQSRETAASYALWELQKTGLVELDGNQVSRKSWAWHISNKYAQCPTLANAKIRVADIFT